MEQSNIQEKYNNKLLFKLCQIGFGLNANLLFTNRIIENKNDITAVKNLNYGDKILIYLNEIPFNYNELVNILKDKQIKVNFYICAEPLVSLDLVNLLLPYTIHMYLQNNIYEHAQIHTLPIGIRDCENVVPNHRGFSHKFLYNEKQNKVEKNILCLLCFSYTHDERKKCYDVLKNKDWIVNLNDNIYEEQLSRHCGKVPISINYEYTHKSIYVLCPRGYGEDTHRFYESIYLDSIPIVKRSNTTFDKVYDKFPCLVVNDWDDIIEGFLKDNLESCNFRLQNFKTKYPEAFTNLDSIANLLLEL